MTRAANTPARYRPIEAYIHLPAIWIDDGPPRGAAIVWPRMTERVLHRRLAAGYDVTVTREGLIAFDFTGTDLDYGPIDAHRLNTFEHPEVFVRMQARAEALTFHAACLVQARAEPSGAHGFRVMPVTTSRLIHFDQGSTNPACYDLTIWSRIAERHDGGLHEHLAGPLPTWVSAPPPEWVVPATLVRSFDLFDKHYDPRRRGSVRAVAMLLHATEHLERNELPQAFAVGWMVIESFIARRWDQHVRASETGRASPEVAAYIRSLRRPRPTVFERLAGLRIAEPSVAEYSRAEKLRELRNELMHDLAQIDGREAADCVGLGTEMLRLVEGMDLHIGGGYGYAL